MDMNANKYKVPTAGTQDHVTTGSQFLPAHGHNHGYTHEFSS